ncbi:MAG TPA: HAD family hydrolase [Sedimenticola thiotaurini]|uniref:HAD family hydrolase n=1 Tax=Sedimenticola thiotaurini TaxID=1543721 RepID=A0A831RML8_9GAMM|nr:HAD family hydrolase [Sedimenticola thiotaurini]
MAELEALIFDVDGTLADTEREGHRVAFNAAFSEAGLDWVWDEALYGRLLAVTGGKERMRYYLDHFNREFPRPADLDRFIAGLHAAKTRHYKQLMAEGRIPLRTGVRRLLEEAREQGLRLAIATTTTPDNVTALLENSLEAGGSDWFEVIAAGDVVPAKKPAPDIYLWALEQLGLKPGQCLALEDSHNGVLSVLDAGIRSLVVTVNGYTRDEDFGGATLVVDHLGEPGEPCQALYGDLNGRTMVDVPLLREMHAAQ